MLVKFSCGCIGLINIPGDEEHGDRALVLYPCDLRSEDCWEPLCMYRRDLSDKTHTPLAPERAVQILSEMGGLISDGYSFRKVQSLLGRSNPSHTS